MSNRRDEVLANHVTRKRGARKTIRRVVNQTIEQVPNAPATQADITKIYQVVAHLLQ